MNRNYKKDVYLIDLISKSYLHHKRVLQEVENGVQEYDYMKVRASRRVVDHINNVVNDMPSREKIIIDNEVINNKKGSKWYMEYFSIPSYYRIRKDAYRMFLENIEK